MHVVAGVPRHASREGSAGLCCEEWEEDVSGRTFVPMQEVWFTALHTSSGAYTQSSHLTSVILCGEDLCGKVAIGQSEGRLNMQVKANNMTMLSPRAAMASPLTLAEWDRWHTDMLSEPRAVLSNLCEALAAWLQPQPVHADILLALLLSAVTAGQSPKHIFRSDRSQVHVIIGCEGHGAGLMQIIKRASRLLTPHCIFHGAWDAQLPKAQSYPVPGVEKGMRVDAGSLGLADSGVLVLQLYQLKEKEQDSLAHILEHNSIVLCPDPALNVPVTATLWMTAEQDDIEQLCSQNGKGRIGSTSAKTNMSGRLMGEFDIVASYCTCRQTDMELDTIDHILDRPAWSSAGSQQPSIEQMSALGRSMKRHMAMAACMQQPSMTAAATNFLQQYFTALRQYDGDCEVTAGTVSSLARLAAASARLHLRDNVLALPDAVLAIVTFERSCEAQGLRSQMARDICTTLNVVPDGEELEDHLQATYTALKAHFAGRDMDIAREE
ncbi:probable DNA helicase MCM9 [Coccomyxa sp. Obi]|nr:probable DNA helicase MCM9 [Coccomyxa sp. Obi]